MSIRGRGSKGETLSLRIDFIYVQEQISMGNVITSVQTLAARAWNRLQMSKLTKTVKAVLVAGACGIGLCAVGRKFKLARVVSDFAQSVEAVPFPGTRLYSFLAGKQLRTLYAAVADQLVDANSFHRLLDLGTGTGYLPIEIARHDPEISVIGVDKSPDMIRIARANARAFGTTGSVEFSVGDPANLPYPGRYFDIVVSVNVLHHLQDPLAVFEEVNHILAPGGQFWIYDYRKDVPDDVWENIECNMSAGSRLAIEFGPAASSRAAFSEDKLLDLASQANFVDPEVEEISLPLFGCDMPVFVRTILHKPEQNVESDLPTC